MKQKIIVSTASITDTKLRLEISEPLQGLKPGGQILVDSEQYSFVYLMEDKDDYTYIVIPEHTWLEIKTALDTSLSVWLTGPDQSIELVNFQDELDYIISNIKGNSNYGNDMVAKVEEIFN
ncbi:hypothetical protein [Bacillus rubiinfantis]|uniref:UPF0738 family protein n=1 Tax=Bacillus rubiinfantis TaxID=1499680 RepID=UPI0005AB3AF5|nr:hypothetical protein [Bacillus rubiinfantis]